MVHIPCHYQTFAELKGHTFPSDSFSFVGFAGSFPTLCVAKVSSNGIDLPHHLHQALSS